MRALTALTARVLLGFTRGGAARRRCVMVIMGTTPTLFVSSGVSGIIRAGMSANVDVSVRRAVAWLAESDEQ